MLILLLAALLADVPAPSGGPYVTYRSNPTLSNEKVLPTCAAGECLSYNGSSLFCGTCSAGSGSPPGGLANDLQINNGSGGFSAYAGTTCAYAIKSLDDDGDATCTAAPTIPPPGGIVNDIQTNNGSGGFGVYAGTTCAYAVKSLDGDGVATCTAAPTIPTDLSAEPFITKTASGNLSGEFALGSLATGIIVNTTTTGIPTIYGGTSCSAGQYMNALNSSGVRTCAQVAYSELSGTPTIPADISAASFITKVAEANLSNEFALGSLATGLLKNTTTTGVPTIAVSGTDYAPATSGSVLLLGNGAGGFSNYGGASSCTNQFFTGLSSAGASTCSTATLASAQFANQGTTTQVLHGNAAGNPSWAAVDLSADTAATVLPLSKGGTNKNNTASNGAIVYSDASTFTPSTVGTSGQVLTSGGAGAPTWTAGQRLIRVSGSNFTTTATTNTNITGLSITTAAATPYYFDCLLDVTGTATGGPRIAVVVTTSTVTSMAVAIRSHSTSATTMNYTGASATGTQSAACTASCLTADIPFSIHGMVNINANAGTITIAASNSTAGQTTTVKIGSSCTWTTP